MSLDVYLIGKKVVKRASHVFVRDHGSIREIPMEEWRKLNPGIEPCVISPHETSTVFSANITHNLTEMAEEAGIYKPLWRPEEVGITKASQLIPLLQAGLALLKSDPERFKWYNPSNGLGSYDDFVPWVEEYLKACEEHPDATVEVDR